MREIYPNVKFLDENLGEYIYNYEWTFKEKFRRYFEIKCLRLCHREWQRIRCKNFSKILDLSDKIRIIIYAKIEKFLRKRKRGI